MIDNYRDDARPITEEGKRLLEQRQIANDALMLFVKPGRFAADIRANLLIVEQLVNGCHNLKKEGDGWSMGWGPDASEFLWSIDPKQLALAERLLKLTKQTVRYRTDAVLITFEWKES